MLGLKDQLFSATSKTKVNMMIPNIYAASGLLILLTCLGLVIICLKFSQSPISKVWSLFNISVGFWGLGAYLVACSTSPNEALYNWRFAHLGGIFIPVCFYHVVCVFCHLKRKLLIIFAYVQGFLFLLLNNTNYFIYKVEYLFNSLYYHKSQGFFYPLFTVIWVSLVVLGIIELFQFYKTAHKIEKTKILYFFVGLLTGFLGGITNFLPMFNLNVYPFGNLTIPLYCLIVTHAILKYRLLDVSIAITRTSIFVAVYSLVLGTPFALAFGLKQELNILFGENWWIVPLISSTVLATAGPFMYLYIQKKAEDRLLQEQHRYQMTLRQASSGMSRIKDLRKLLKLIVHIVTRTVHIEHSSIYLLNPNEKKYCLEAFRSSGQLKLNGVIDSRSLLVNYLSEVKEPVVYEEIRQKMRDFGDPRLMKIESQLQDLHAAVAIPSFVEEKLLAIITLGKKQSGKLYSADDLAVFSILANQAALAIENAQFYEDVKRTQQQLFQAEKMATIGTMADGLSHQINNRLHALGFIAGDALDTLKLKKPAQAAPEIEELLSEIQHSLERIQENVKQGGEVVEGLLRYTRKGDAGFVPVDLDKLVNASLEMAQYKVKLDQINLVRDYPADLPKIHGNFTQLQEVFFNLIDNAYDSVMQRKNERNEPDFKGKLQISAKKRDDLLEISVLDNGMGVKDEDLDKLFTPFFTTKLSSKKGTGLGLYVIQKIIEENHKGKVSISSEYMTGALITILLPVVG